MDTKINLCNTCKYSIPTCNSGEVVYGNGRGNDNIIRCEGYENEKRPQEGVINREETVIHIMRNPEQKAKMIKSNLGEPLEDAVVYLNYNNELVHGFIGGCITTPFPVYVKNDKAEFEIIRELKKMTFIEAVAILLGTDKIMKSLLTGKEYYSNEPLKYFTLEDMRDLWTVDGIYE